MEEIIVCQICDTCFNSRERAPLLICPSSHSACKACVDSFRLKGIARCPFCRVDLDFAGLRQNEGLVGKLGKYESEEKSLAKKNPSMMSENELVYWVSDESRKNKYLSVYEKIINRHKSPLKDVVEIVELKHKLTTPIDLTIFPNIHTLNFGREQYMQIATGSK